MTIITEENKYFHVGFLHLHYIYTTVLWKHDLNLSYNRILKYFYLDVPCITSSVYEQGLAQL